MEEILTYFYRIRWQDYLDIAIVAVLVYSLLVRLKGTKAFQIMMGIALLFVLSFLTKWGGLYVTSWISQYLWAVILLSLIILFQPEIRGILEEVSPLKVIKGRGSKADPDANAEALAAAFDLASKKIGAIVVFPRKDSVEEFLQDGVDLESILSKPLIMSIFSPGSPLHDGAIIIRGSRIIKAGCFLPLTDSSQIPQYYGSRHRAAMGLTERTDAVCLVVSEERGEVSLWSEGKAWTCHTGEYASEHIEKLLQSGSQSKGPFIWKRWVRENFWIKVFSLAFAPLGRCLGCQDLRNQFQCTHRIYRHTSENVSGNGWNRSSNRSSQRVRRTPRWDFIRGSQGPSEPFQCQGWNQFYHHNPRRSEPTSGHTDHIHQTIGCQACS